MKEQLNVTKRKLWSVEADFLDYRRELENEVNKKEFEDIRMKCIDIQVFLTKLKIGLEEKI